MGSLIILRHLQSRVQGAGLTILASMAVTGGSADNLGNTYALSKFYTQRWPGAAILMEISAIMLSSVSYMAINHVPRERNTWADPLANLDTSGFDPSKRWDPLEELKENIVLNDLLLFGEQLGFHLPKKEREAKKKKVSLVPASARKPFPGRPLAASALKKQRTF